MNEIQGKLEQNEVNNSSTAHSWVFLSYSVSLCAFLLLCVIEAVLSVCFLVLELALWHPAIDSKMILHNYILYWGEQSYIGIFPLYLRMALIFKDFLTGSGSQPCAVLKSVNIRAIPKQTGKIPT